MKNIFITLGLLGGILIYTTAGGCDLGLLGTGQVVCRVLLGIGMILAGRAGYRFNRHRGARRKAESCSATSMPPKTAA